MTDDEVDGFLARMFSVRRAILAAGAKPRSSGQLDCPLCNKSKVQWAMHHNGHIHARCGTEGCIAWVE